MKTLLSNGSILIRDAFGYKMLENAFLGIDNDTINYIDIVPPKDTYDKVIPLEDHLVMPGLINCHGHSPMTLLRGIGSGNNLQDWLVDYIFPFEAKLTPKDIYYGQTLANLEMLSSGTTSFISMYDCPYSASLAISKCHIKANISAPGLCDDEDINLDNDDIFHNRIDFVDILNGKKDCNDDLKYQLNTISLPNDIKEAVKDKLIQPIFSYHSEYLTTPKYVKGLIKEIKSRDAFLDVHISETLLEHNECLERQGCTPIEYFNKLGALSNKTTCAHCVFVSDNDLKIMKETGATLVFNPSSNMKLCSGFAPIKKAIDLGVNVAIGTDGCASNDTLDMFKEMHLAALVANIACNNPSAIKPSDILDMATINGAKATGRLDTGKIELGYKADLIVIDLNKIHLNPIHDIASLLVYSTYGDDVVMTFVDGKLVYDHGKFPLVDVNEIKLEFDKSVNRLINDK